MDKSNKNLSNLLIAIQSQIKLIEDQIKSIYGKKLDELQQLFGKDINSLTVSDLKEQPLSKLNRIADYIELGDKYNRMDLTDEDVLRLLLNDINDYIKVNQNRIDDAERRIESRALFVEILSTKKIPSDIKDITTLNKEFNKCIDSLGSVSAEDKLVAYKTMSLAIDRLPSLTIEPEVVDKTRFSYSYVIDYPEVKDAILNYIDENGLVVNVNFLSAYAKEIAGLCGNSPELIQNVFVGMLMGQEYNKLKNGISKKKSQRNLSRLSELAYDDKKIILAEANRILRKEINELRNVQIDSFEEIIVSDAIDEMDFEFRKERKKVIIAYILKQKLEDYKNNVNHELDEEYKDLILGLMDEYHNTDMLEYNQGKTR